MARKGDVSQFQRKQSHEGSYLLNGIDLGMLSKREEDLKNLHPYREAYVVIYTRFAKIFHIPFVTLPSPTIQ
jgi:hypothetical protein